MTTARIGIIGSGMLGHAILTAWLDSGTVRSHRLRVANRSGQSPVPGVSTTSIARDLAGTCDIIMLCVPPDQIGTLRLHAPDALILSVMAGVTRQQLTELTGSKRVVRAMSSPSARGQMAYTPWIASEAVTAADRNEINRLFCALGPSDEITDEAHMDYFTALSGPVPGFVAWLASAMYDNARAQGISQRICDRAIRQLFLAAGTAISDEELSPHDHVQQMVDYAGTTAKGLEILNNSDAAQIFDQALLAAARATRDLT